LVLFEIGPGPTRFIRVGRGVALKNAGVVRSALTADLEPFAKMACAGERCRSGRTGDGRNWNGLPLGIERGGDHAFFADVGVGILARFKVSSTVGMIIVKNNRNPQGIGKLHCGVDTDVHHHD